MNMLEKMFSLKGKVVIVTGGAQGIGKVVAEHLAAVGADIVIFDRQAEKAKAVAESVAREYGCKTSSFEVDVTNPENVAQAIQNAAEVMGKLDHLFNNAGIALHKPAIDYTPDEWLRVINVNLNGEFFAAQAFARYLIGSDRKGAIVNTASMSASIVNMPQEQAAYNTSKAGVLHMTKSLAVEWASKGIRVNCISPGYIATELVAYVNEDWKKYWIESCPFKRMGTPEELAGAVIYLLSDSASFTSGCDLIVDGCYTVV